MSEAIGDRVFVRVDLEYALAGSDGWRTPDTHSKSWFFEVSRALDAKEPWNELLNRIFYDCNVRLRRREPNDAHWLQLESFRTSPVDAAAAIAWDGKSVEAVPWMTSEAAVVWESSSCYFVDDAGRYDMLSGGDYAELLMLRLLNAGTINEAIFVTFFNRFYSRSTSPSPGKVMYDDRTARLNNLIVVRAASDYRKEPGQKPWTSGPVDPALI